MVIGDQEELRSAIAALTQGVATLSTAVATLTTKVEYVQKATEMQQGNASEIALIKQTISTQKEYQDRQSALNRWLVGIMVTVGIFMAGTAITVAMYLGSHITMVTH